MHTHRLLDLPHDEARRLVATGAPVYLTINPVEYHGPHLSLHNDRLVSEGLARDLHARLAPRHPDWPFLLADDIEVGVEPCPGIGTRHQYFTSARDAVRAACHGLADLGARRVILMTFHGAPLHGSALEAGVTLLTRLGVRCVSPFNIILRELINLDTRRFDHAVAPVPDAADREAARRQLPVDFHAGFFETSVALHYAPSSVSPKYRQLPPCPELVPAKKWLRFAHLAEGLRLTDLAAEMRFAAVGQAWRDLRPFPGYTGRPHLASAEVGALFTREIINRYEPVVEEVLDGRRASPRTIFSWMATASLHGRIGRLQIPTTDEMLAVPQFAVGAAAPAPRAAGSSPSSPAFATAIE